MIRLTHDRYRYPLLRRESVELIRGELRFQKHNFHQEVG